MPSKKIKKLKKTIANLRQDYRRLLRESLVNKERASVFRHLADVHKSFNEILQISLQPVPLVDSLKNILDIILSVPWLALEKKGCIFLTDSDDEMQLNMAVHRNLDASLLQTCNKIDFGQCLCGKSAKSHQIIFKDCIDDDHENIRPGITPHGHHIVPILSGSKVLGVLNLYVKQNHKPELLETHFLQAVTGILSGIIIKNNHERQLSQMSFEDDLTGLPNRRLFLKQLEYVLQRVKRSFDKIAVLYLDLDRFKPVNDLYGHDIGDQLLIEVSQRIKSCLREMDVLARIGGDEFVVLLELFRNHNEITRLKDRIKGEIRQPFIIKENRIKIDVSIGISFYPEDGHTCSELIKMADQAMYMDKKRRTG